MKLLLQILVLAIVFLPLIVAATVLAQKLYPTTTDDAPARRYSYGLLVRVLQYGSFFALVGAIYLLVTQTPVGRMTP